MLMIELLQLLLAKEAAYDVIPIRCPCVAHSLTPIIISSTIHTSFQTGMDGRFDHSPCFPGEKLYTESIFLPI